jgi:hypothetical protein
MFDKKNRARKNVIQRKRSRKSVAKNSTFCLCSYLWWRMRHPLELLVVMPTFQQKMDWGVWIADLISVTPIQRKFRLVRGGLAPSYNSIKKTSERNGSAVSQKSPGRPRTPNEDKRIKQVFAPTPGD